MLFIKHKIIKIKVCDATIYPLSFLAWLALSVTVQVLQLNICMGLSPVTDPVWFSALCG